MCNFLPDIPERRNLSGQRRKSDRNVCVSAWRRRTVINSISVSVAAASQSLSASWHMVRNYVPKRTKLGYPPEWPIISITRKKSRQQPHTPKTTIQALLPPSGNVGFGSTRPLLRSKLLTLLNDFFFSVDPRLTCFSRSSVGIILSFDPLGSCVSSLTNDRLESFKSPISIVSRGEVV